MQKGVSLIQAMEELRRENHRFHSDAHCHLETAMNPAQLSAELTRISEARHHDPFSVLGRHPDGDQVVVRAFNPHATEVFIAEGNRTS